MSLYSFKQQSTHRILLSPANFKIRFQIKCKFQLLSFKDFFYTFKSQSTSSNMCNMSPFVVTLQNVEKFTVNAGEYLRKASQLDSPGLLCWGGVLGKSSQEETQNTLVTLHFSSGLGLHMTGWSTETAVHIIGMWISKATLDEMSAALWDIYNCKQKLKLYFSTVQHESAFEKVLPFPSVVSGFGFHSVYL